MHLKVVSFLLVGHYQSIDFLTLDVTVALTKDFVGCDPPLSAEFNSTMLTFSPPFALPLPSRSKEPPPRSLRARELASLIRVLIELLPFTCMSISPVFAPIKLFRLELAAVPTFL